MQITQDFEILNFNTKAITVKLIKTFNSLREKNSYVNLLVSDGFISSGNDTFKVSPEDMLRWVWENNYEVPEILEDFEEQVISHADHWAVIAESAVSPIKLKDYQGKFVRKTYNRILTQQAILNCCEPGTGKTIMALTTAMKGRRDTPLLILAPNAAHGTFARDLRKLGYQEDIHIITGKDFDLTKSGAIIMTYDSLPPIAKEGLNKKPMEAFLEDLHPQCELIADEFHQVKNNKAKKTIRFRTLAKRFIKNKKTILALTGTPIMNRPNELWNLLVNLGLHKRAFGDYQGFLYMFGGYKGRFGIEFNESARKPHLIKKALSRIMYRVTKSEILDQLPDISIKEVPVDISKDQKKALDNIYSQVDHDKPILEQKLILQNLSKIKEALAVSKIPYAEEICASYEEAEIPLLVCSDHVNVVQKIGKRKGWAYIDGSVSQKDRDNIQELFNQGLLRGVAFTIKAGGIGMNLHGAAHMLFVDQNYTNALNEQARNRNDRIDHQHEKLTYVYLVADHPMEWLIQEALSRKESLVNDCL